MFKDKALATEINNIMLDVSSVLDESVSVVANSNCSEEEKTLYYKIVGRVLGIISHDVLNDIYRLHPEVKPEEYLLPEDYKKSDD